MKISKKIVLRVLATTVVAGLTMGTMSTSAQAASKKTLNIWWYEKDTAMATTWNDALIQFKKAHPDVKVNFQLKTWAQLQNAGNALLSSNSAPDVSEWNKGNATAGSASQAGLLSNLNAYDKKYHWDKVLTPSIKAYGQYTNGLMGNGNLYGVPSYGEYVSWFYNKDAFANAGIDVPKTFAGLEAALAKFKAAGQTPIALAGKDWIPVVLYGFVASKASLQWVRDFQSFAHPVNFNGPEWSFGAKTIVAWNKAGYFEPNATGIDTNAAVADFQKGTYPLLFGGSWLDQDMATKITSFKWGKFAMPGKLSVGSAGNLLVIPAKSKQKDLAAAFINMIISTKYQNELAAKSGLPIAATPAAVAAVKDPTSKLTNALFNSIVKTQGLAMYPDWPVNGYYNELLADATQLLLDGNVSAYISKTAAFYNSNKP